MKILFDFLKILFLTIPTLSLFGQDSLSYSEVRNLFKEEESIWVNFYSGYDNLGNQYLLILGNDQKTEKGFLHLINKKTKLQVEGTYQKTKYLVTDHSGDIWGNLSGIKKDSLLILNLLPKDKKNAFDLSLKEVSRNKSSPGECPQNLSNSFFSNDSMNAYLNIQVFEDGKVHGYFTSIKDSLSFFLSGNCKDPLCNKIQFTATSITHWNKQKIEIILTDELNLNFKNFSSVYSYKLKKRSVNNFTCFSFFNNEQVIQARFLNLDNRAYQKWVQEFSQNWISSALRKVITPLDSISNIKLNFDVATANTQLISGNFFWNEAGYRLNINYPFNYNLRTGEIIQLSDLFEKNMDYKTFLRNYIDSSKQILSIDLIRPQKNFILSDQFSYWTILPTGLCFTSEFNSIYGTYRVLVPYKKLEPIIKKNSILKKYL